MIKIYIRFLVNTVKSILLIYHLSFPKCYSIKNEGQEAGELFLCKAQGQREVAGEVSEEMWKADGRRSYHLRRVKGNRDSVPVKGLH